VVEAFQADESLRTFGNKYFKDSFFKPKKPVIVYGKNHLQIGKRVKGGGVYAIDIEEACRFIICGSTRSGKSFLIRSLTDRLKLTNKSIVHLNDTKNEFFTSNEPVQEKFRDNLLPGEKPSPTKTVVLRPTFFKQISKQLAEKNFWYSVNMKEISRSDFMTLMNSQEMSPNQRTALELIYQEMSRRIKENPDLGFTVDLIIDIINNIEGMTNTQKNQMRFKFEPLRQSFFFEKEYERDIVKLLKKGYVVSINTEGFDNFGKGNFLFPEVTLNIAVNEIIRARMRKEIPELWLMIDEAPRFLGKSKQNSFKDTILESYDLHGRYAINYVSAFQNLIDVPERILMQSRYIFVPKTIDVKTLQQVLVHVGVVKNIQRSMNRAMEIKRELGSNKYSWAIFDRMNSTYDFITPLAPLSKHAETEK
jgi:hypothetical protein